MKTRIAVFTNISFLELQGWQGKNRNVQGYGVEPFTRSDLAMRRYTKPRIKVDRPESNWQPSPPQGDALTKLSYEPRIGGPTGG